MVILYAKFFIKKLQNENIVVYLQTKNAIK